MSSKLALPLVCPGLLLLAGCAGKIGPGYRIAQERIELHYVSAQPPRLAVGARYRLENVGDRPLAFVEVALPGVESFGRQNLHLEVGGRKVAPAAVPDSGEAAVRISFDPPWPQKQRRAVQISYEINGGSGARITESACYLGDSAWFPEFQEPEELFALDIVRPVPTEVTISAPADFLVASSGRAAGARQRNGEVEHRFRLGQQDSDPFVVAGRFREQRVRAGGSTIVFWSLEPLDSAAAERAGKRLAGTVQAYAKAFGPVGSLPAEAWIVEAPAPPGAAPEKADGPSAVAFPRGVLLTPEAFALGLANDSFLALAERTMAQVWFVQAIQLRPEVRWAISDSLDEYATIVAAAARGDAAARPQAISRWLRQYHQAVASAVEKPLAALRPGDPREQRRIALSKGPLFLMALEDQCGQESLNRALAHLIRSLGGKEVGFAELRAALEQETGRDLAGLFRSWLDQTGIPSEFRARYATQD